MNGTDAMRARQKARIQEIPDAPVSNGALRSVNLACRKFLEQRGMRQSGSRTVVRLSRSGIASRILIVHDFLNEKRK